MRPGRRPRMSKSSVTPTPKEIAQYGIRRRLGAGGMAEVFLAEKRGAERTIKVLVLKRILPSHGSSRRFRAIFVEDANLATRLNHPNVVQVFEFQDAGDDGLLLAMEYVEGCDLGRLMHASRSDGTRIPRGSAHGSSARRPRACTTRTRRRTRRAGRSRLSTAT